MCGFENPGNSRYEAFYTPIEVGNYKAEVKANYIEPSGEKEVSKTETIEFSVTETAPVEPSNSEEPKVEIVDESGRELPVIAPSPGPAPFAKEASSEPKPESQPKPKPEPKQKQKPKSKSKPEPKQRVPKVASGLDMVSEKTDFSAQEFPSFTIDTGAGNEQSNIIFQFKQFLANKIDVFADEMPELEVVAKRQGQSNP